ncbi:MAG: hypothetical protein AVDCRST_MAG79-2600, partial [uncultured Thermoleophilia bacterium]
ARQSQHRRRAGLLRRDLEPAHRGRGRRLPGQAHQARGRLRLASPRRRRRALLGAGGQAAHALPRSRRRVARAGRAPRDPAGRGAPAERPRPVLGRPPGARRRRQHGQRGRRADHRAEAAGPV